MKPEYEFVFLLEKKKTIRYAYGTISIQDEVHVTVFVETRLGRTKVIQGLLEVISQRPQWRGKD